MAKKLALALVLVFVPMLWVLNLPAQASPQAQATPLPTPTPGADGRVIYTVQPGDSQWLIAAKFNIDIDQLRILNNWTAEDTLVEGQIVLLGLASPEEPTAAPTEEGEPTPEVTPENPGTGMICVLLFEDVNGDALRQETEFGIAAGAVSVSARVGGVSETAETTDLTDLEEGEPIPTCFEDLPIGEYSISVAAPEGYNPTTAQSATMTLNAGDQTTLNFGAQLSSEARALNLSPSEGGRSPLMGLLGIALLLSGVGLGAYTWQLARGR